MCDELTKVRVKWSLDLRLHTVHNRLTKLSNWSQTIIKGITFVLRYSDVYACTAVIVIEH